METEENNEDLLMAMKELRLKLDVLQRKVGGGSQRKSDTSDAQPDLDEMREILGVLLDKQVKMENTFGVDKVGLKDAGDKILVTIDTNFGTIVAHADKKDMPGGVGVGIHSPITYSGSTVAGAGGPAPGGLGGGKGGGPHGMTPEQLQEFKKQSLQIGAAQQKLRELETKLTDAISGIKKGVEKTADMEEKQTESTKELYACIDQINTSLSEKIALQKVEVQKIAGDTPKPINYDPFNYGEAYAGDLVDFQARKRITELKLLMQGLQAALLQMRDSTKVSPTIDLGYKVVRLDQLVGSTGFGQKVATGEVGPDEVLLVEPSSERNPGKIEYPRKSMNQTSPEMESKWSITDSIMQTMYRLEMELGDIQKIVDSTGLSSGSKVIEEVQQSIKQLRDRQIDVRTVKRLIEDAKESSQINLMAGRKSAAATAANQRNTLPQIHSDNSDVSLIASRKLEQSIKHMQGQIDSISRGMQPTTKVDSYSKSSAVSKKGKHGTACLSCNRQTNGCSTAERPSASLPVYPYFSPGGQQPRIRGPIVTHYGLHRAFKIDVSTHQIDDYTIPRACGGGYHEEWPLPKSFDVSRYKHLFEPPVLMKDTKYIKGKDGQVYRGCTRYAPSSAHKKEVPMKFESPKNLADRKGKGIEGQEAPFGERFAEENQGKQQQPQQKGQLTPSGSADPGDTVAVVVQAASDDDTNRHAREQEAEEERQLEKERRASMEQKTYKFTMHDGDLEGDDDEGGRDDGEATGEKKREEEAEKEEKREEEEEAAEDGAAAEVKAEEKPADAGGKPEEEEPSAKQEAESPPPEEDA